MNRTLFSFFYIIPVLLLLALSGCPGSGGGGEGGGGEGGGAGGGGNVGGEGGGENATLLKIPEPTITENKTDSSVKLKFTLKNNSEVTMFFDKDWLTRSGDRLSLDQNTCKSHPHIADNTPFSIGPGNDCWLVYEIFPGGYFTNIVINYRMNSKPEVAERKFSPPILNDL
jgi:hypothetical protein